MQKVFENGYYALLIGDENVLVYCIKDSGDKIYLKWPCLKLTGR